MQVILRFVCCPYRVVLCLISEIAIYAAIESRLQGQKAAHRNMRNKIILDKDPIQGLRIDPEHWELCVR